MREELTADTMKLNTKAPSGFTQAPRVLSHEVAMMREEMAALKQAMGLLVDLQREANTKLDAALGQSCGAG